MTTTILNLIFGFILFVNQNLDGNWQAKSAVLGGTSLPEAVVKDIVLVLKDGTYDVQNDKGTVKFLEPNLMEITGQDGPNSGKTLKAIYEFTGDELVICYDLSGMVFPEQFTSPVSTKFFLVKYSRVK